MILTLTLDRVYFYLYTMRALAKTSDSCTMCNKYLLRAMFQLNVIESDHSKVLLSLSLIPGRRAGHRLDPLQKVPKVSRVCVEFSSGPVRELGTVALGVLPSCQHHCSVESQHLIR